MILGKSGQVAWELVRTCPDGWKATACGRNELNLNHPSQLQDAVNELNPDLLINAAAYTAVDKAESEVQQAYQVNQQAVATVADVAKQFDLPLIHISTDFVFDGNHSSPYTNTDPTNPLSVYGASKLAGEAEIRSRELACALILRTSWVYSSHGQNFVKTMLRLMGDPEREQLAVVCDQVGSPTWAKTLAEAIWKAGESMVTGQSVNGTTIANWTDAGVASWYDFAEAIQELALQKKLLKTAMPIRPLLHTAYPTPAKRPQYSVLDKSGFEELYRCQTKHWRKQLDGMLEELVAQVESKEKKNEYV
ncbi:dTDP-4-dehydrorhamnose reductase [Microbulbifer sp. ZGT114]|nr:dTDP-4-dehydrorhamnose reductase [Microbulbifer sp. ZGT114]